MDTTVEIANKVGASEIINRVVDDLKDENEQYRKMVMETIEKIMGNLGAADVDSRLEEQLIDGILYAFQEQTTEVCTSYNFYKFKLYNNNVINLFIYNIGCCNVEWFWYHCEYIRKKSKSISSTNMRYDIMEIK